ncbi:MAG: helix-turn-helix transcriptional regulator [Lachnospiraceae bacterium]|nr:helix-turn-helix transcriptional regulator [Lachnospiraceae bacterium]
MKSYKKRLIYARAYTRSRILRYNFNVRKSISVKDAVVKRFQALCDERNIKINELANISGVTPSTAYSMMDTTRRDISILTIKKFCDGLDITLGEFFSAPDFNDLEQEIR